MSLRFTSFKPGIHKNSDLMQDTFSKLLANQLWDQNRTETVKHGTFCSACHTTATALNHGTGDFHVYEMGSCPSFIYKSQKLLNCKW